MLTRLGFVDYDEGRTAEARERFRTSLALFEQLGDERFRAYAIGYLANTLRAEGMLDEAEEQYREAIGAMIRNGDRQFEAVFRMDLGIARLLAGQAEAARTELAHADAIAREAGDANLGGVIAGYRVTALAQVGRVAEAQELAAQALASASPLARALIEVHARTAEVFAKGAEAAHHARAWLEGEERTPARSEHLRIARRLLREVVDRVVPPADVLVVGADGMTLPGGAFVDLATRRSLLRVLHVLVERRLAKPGEPVPSEALLASGWPGERVLADAGAIRVRVAIADLRRLGLSRTIVRKKGGYLLDSAQRVMSSTKAAGHL
jgi:hypothetical protein